MGDEDPGSKSGDRVLPRWVDDVLGALQAAFGDVIEREAPGISTPLALYDEGRRLPTTREALRAARPDATGRVVVLIHGLGGHEGVWAFPTPRAPRDEGANATKGDPGGTASAPDRRDTYGSRLARDLGFTPYFVRYNTGVAIPRSGERLAAVLEALCEAHPVPVSELALVGHSMGGLVARAACAAAPADAPWVGALRHVVTLGTPHDGAPLEHVAHRTAELLGAVGATATDVLRDVITARSEGIRDLRHGRVRADGPADGPDTTAPWPAHVRLHRVVGLVGGAEPLGAIVGDGMVRAASAGAPRAAGDVAVVRGIGHLGLLHDDRVYAAIRRFCAGAPPAPAEEEAT